MIIDFLFPGNPENGRKNTIFRVNNTYKRLKARGWEDLFIRSEIQDFEFQFSDDLRHGLAHFLKNFLI